MTANGGIGPQYGGATGQDRPYVGLPPLHFAPDDATPFERTVRTTGRVFAGQTAVVAQFEVETNSVLRIAEAGFGALDPTALVHASWSVTRNGNPIMEYGSFPCAIGSLAKPGHVDIVVHGPATVEVLVTNGFPGNGWTYQVRLRGWKFAKKLLQSTWGGS